MARPGRRRRHVAGGDEATRWAGYAGALPISGPRGTCSTGRSAGPLPRRGGRRLLGGRRRTTVRSSTASSRSSPACSLPTTARRWTLGDPSDLAELPPRQGLGRPTPWQWAILGAAALSRSPSSAARWPGRRRVSSAGSRTVTSPLAGSPRRSQLQPRWSCSQPWHCSRGCWARRTPASLGCARLSLAERLALSPPASGRRSRRLHGHLSSRRAGSDAGGRAR